MNLAIDEDGYLSLRGGCSKGQDIGKGKSGRQSRGKEGKPTEGEWEKATVWPFKMM